MNLTPADSARLDAAVQKAESHTSAELVLVIRNASGSYSDVAWVAATVAAGIALVGSLFSEDIELMPHEVVPLVAVFGVLGGMLGWWFGSRLARSKRREAQVDEAALASFARCGVHRTKGKTGLLVYLSLSEKAARLLPDQAIIDSVPSSVRAEWRMSLNSVARAPSVESIAKLVEDLGERVGRYLPRAADDVDELASMPSGASAVELS